jgi:D-3-phosphoglycerate dehydrogenase
MGTLQERFVVLVNDSCSPETRQVYEQAEVRHPGLELRFRDDLEPRRAPELAAEIDLVLVGTQRFEAADLEFLPRLRGVHKLGTGTDNVPVEELERRGIRFANNHGLNAAQVAEHCVALALCHVRRVLDADRSLREGLWIKRELRPTLASLRGRTVALVGFGAAARELARLLQPWGCRMRAFDPNLPETAFAGTGVARAATLREAASGAQLLSVHVPLVDGTKGLIGWEVLRLLAPDALVLNTSRAGVVDTTALERFLEENPTAGAGIDVFAAEPADADDPVLRFPRTVLTPHIAGASKGLIEEHLDRAIDEWTRSRG